jgi:arabinofuranosyltransferase
MSEGFKRQMPPRVITALMGGLSSILCVVCLGTWVFRSTKSLVSGLLASIILASYLPFALWSVQGLETPLYAFLVMSAIVFASIAKFSSIAYLFSFLACLTRPDGLLVPAYIFIVSWTDQDRKKSRTILTAFIFFLAPFIAYSAWRINHFNSVVPNVFFAKTGLGIAGMEVGIRYLFTWAAGSGHIFILFLVSLISMIFYKKTKNICSGIYSPFLFVLVYLSFVIYVGGDFMPDHRFVMHVVPLLIGCGIICLGNAAPKRKLARLVFFLVVLILLTANLLSILHYNYGTYYSHTKKWHQDQAKWYGNTASWLVRNSDRSSVIACGDIGYVGFVTDVDRLIDTNGLVDRYLARHPGAASLNSDPDYVISESPDFIVVMVHYFQNGAMIGHNDFDRKFINDKKLQQGYTEAAELSGWKTIEYSFDDKETRISHIRFKIFKKN